MASDLETLLNDIKKNFKGHPGVEIEHTVPSCDTCLHTYSFSSCPYLFKENTKQCFAHFIPRQWKKHIFIPEINEWWD